jgi:hypothetical protein
LREEWSYDDVMKAVAVLDMHAAVDLARDTYDRAETEAKQREIEAKGVTRRKR